MTIADTSKIGRFCTFFQGYSLWFSLPGAKKSTPEQVVVALQDDSRRREKSFEPITTNVARKLPFLEQFELGAFTMQNGL